MSIGINLGINATTSHNNDSQWLPTTIPADAVASILTQSTNYAISHWILCG